MMEERTFILLKTRDVISKQNYDVAPPVSMRYARNVRYDTLHANSIFFMIYPRCVLLATYYLILSRSSSLQYPKGNACNPGRCKKILNIIESDGHVHRWLIYYHSFFLSFYLFFLWFVIWFISSFSKESSSTGSLGSEASNPLSLVPPNSGFLKPMLSSCMDLTRFVRNPKQLDSRVQQNCRCVVKKKIFLLVLLWSIGTVCFNRR